MKKQGVSLDDEKFVTSVVADEVHSTGVQTVIPIYNLAEEPRAD